MRKTLSGLSALALVLVAAGCGTDLRDAALAGWMDFISGSVSGSLTSLAPAADLITKFLWSGVLG